MAEQKEKGSPTTPFLFNLSIFIAGSSTYCINK